MTRSLVLFLTLRFRRSPSTHHALVSRVVVVVGVAVFAAVAAFGLVYLARQLEYERQLALAPRSVAAQASLDLVEEEPPTTRRRRRPPSEDSTQTDELSETDTTSDGYTLYSDTTSDADDSTVSPLD